MEIRAEKISKTYGKTTVLQDVSFDLDKGQKVGLIGGNGTGKTTLLKIINGIIEADSGSITKRNGLVIGYMPQDTSLATDETIRDYLRRVTGINTLEEIIEKSREALSEYEQRKGYIFDHRIDATLAGLGLKEIPNTRQINSLSSGQKSKVFMAGLLLTDPDVLLLDEPTNNLDLPALIWLEKFLINTDSTCIIISHDRLFLDRIVNKIFEINWDSRSLNVIGGRYSDYLERKEVERASQLEKHEDQQDEIKRLTATAKEKRIEATEGSRYRGTDNDKVLRGFKRERAGRSNKSAKAIDKRIEQIDLVEKPLVHESLRINLTPARPEGSREITLRNVIAGYPDGEFQVGPISLNISYGDRVAILGLNGSGKSTLVKTISGELKPISGEVEVGKSLILGNLMQEHDNLPRDESIKDFLKKRIDINDHNLYNFAHIYGFNVEEVNNEISALSPGGRARLLIALFSLLSINVLLLDEPTNHLDLDALSALEEVIANYEGTIILVSHDRYFLSKFNATDVYVITDGKLERQSNYEYESSHTPEAII